MSLTYICNKEYYYKSELYDVMQAIKEPENSKKFIDMTMCDIQQNTILIAEQVERLQIGEEESVTISGLRILYKNYAIHFTLDKTTDLVRVLVEIHYDDSVKKMQPTMITFRYK